MKLPYQIFPGVFSRLDLASKAAVQTAIQTKNLFTWMQDLPEIAEVLKITSWRSFRAVDTETGLGVQGVPDAMFRMADGTYMIIDYKVAAVTDRQDALSAQYRAQLSIYAFIGEKVGFQPVTRLALIYHEPVNRASFPTYQIKRSGFLLPFQIYYYPVELDPCVPDYFKIAKSILAQTTPPEPRPYCDDCEKTLQLFALLTGEEYVKPKKPRASKK